MKHDFVALDGGEAEELEGAWNSEDDPDESKKKPKRSNSKKSNTSSSRSKQKKNAAGAAELETTAKQYEDEIAELVPKVEAYRRRLDALTTENMALKERIYLLESQISRRDGVVAMSGYFQPGHLPELGQSSFAEPEGGATGIDANRFSGKESKLHVVDSSLTGGR